MFVWNVLTISWFIICNINLNETFICLNFSFTVSFTCLSSLYRLLLPTCKNFGRLSLVTMCCPFGYGGKLLFHRWMFFNKTLVTPYTLLLFLYFGRKFQEFRTTVFFYLHIYFHYVLSFVICNDSLERTRDGGKGGDRNGE